MKAKLITFLARIKKSLAVLLLLPALGFAQQPQNESEDLSLTDRINYLRKGFWETVDREAWTPHAEAVERLNGNYLVALKKAHQAASSRGDQSKADILQGEINRIEQNSPLKPEKREFLERSSIAPPQTYINALKKLETTRDAKLLTLLNRYEKAIVALRPFATDRKDAYRLDSHRKSVSRLRTTEGALLPRESRPAPKEEPQIKGRLLATVPMIHQDRMYCGPACVTMVAQYYGRFVTQETVAQLSSRDSERHRGTQLEELKESLQRLGFDAEIVNLNSDDPGRSLSQTRKHVESQGFLFLKSEIDAGRPVIFNFKPKGSDGHYSLFMGYEEAGEKRIVYQIDPNSNGRPIKWTVDQLADQWPRRSGQTNVICFVVKDPPPTSAEKFDGPKASRETRDQQLALFEPLIAELEKLTPNNVREADLARLRAIGPGFHVVKRDIVRGDKTGASTRARRFAEETGLDILKGEIAAGRPALAICEGEENTEFRLVVKYDDRSRTLSYRLPASPESVQVPYKDFCDDWTRKINQDQVLEVIYVASLEQNKGAPNPGILRMKAKKYFNKRMLSEWTEADYLLLDAFDAGDLSAFDRLSREKARVARILVTKEL